MTLSAKSLQQKRARKELKRKLKRKAIRLSRNQWNSLGKGRQRLAQERCRRKLGINMALENLNKLIKKWSDKISLDLIAKVESQKVVLLTALKTKNLTVIDKAIQDFIPLDKEVQETVAKYDVPVNPTVIPVENNSEPKA